MLFCLDIITDYKRCSFVIRKLSRYSGLQVSFEHRQLHKFKTTTKYLHEIFYEERIVKETVDNSQRVKFIQVDKRKVIKQGGLTNYPLNLVHNYITGSAEVFTCVDQEGIPKEFYVFSYNHEDFLTASLKALKEQFLKGQIQKILFYSD